MPRRADAVQNQGPGAEESALVAVGGGFLALAPGNASHSEFAQSAGGCAVGVGCIGFPAFPFACSVTPQLKVDSRVHEESKLFIALNIVGRLLVKRSDVAPWLL